MTADEALHAAETLRQWAIARGTKVIIHSMEAPPFSADMPRWCVHPTAENALEFQAPTLGEAVAMAAAHVGCPMPSSA